MPEVAPPPAVVAAGSVSAFILADADIAEVLAPLAPFTTPARFQALVAELAAHPHALARLRRKYGWLGELCPTYCLPRGPT